MGSNQLIKTLFEVHPDDKGKPEQEQKTYLEKLREAFKEECDLIKILANIGAIN